MNIYIKYHLNIKKLKKTTLNLSNSPEEIIFLFINNFFFILFIFQIHKNKSAYAQILSPPEQQMQSNLPMRSPVFKGHLFLVLS